MSTGDPGRRPDNWSRFASYVAEGGLFTFAWQFFTLILLTAAAVGVILLMARGEVSIVTMKDSELMRGLITLIILLSVLVLVSILVLAAIFANDADSTAKRVVQCREVLAPLLGILGTIVGFYFGLNADDRQAPPSNGSQVAPVAPGTTQTAVTAQPTPESSVPGSETESIGVSR